MYIVYFEQLIEEEWEVNKTGKSDKGNENTQERQREREEDRDREKYTCYLSFSRHIGSLRFAEREIQTYREREGKKKESKNLEKKNHLTKLIGKMIKKGVTPMLS